MKISIVYEAAPLPNRLNEDACAVRTDGESIALFVADGAKQRLPTDQTKALFEQYGAGVNAARFASQTARAVFYQSGDPFDPPAFLLRANQQIRDGLIQVYGELSANALRQREPQLAAYLDEDPRLMRLALPACVATAVHIDRGQNRLTYAHAGDTMLLLFHADGGISIPTGDQMDNYDEEALQLARQVQADHAADHLSDVLHDVRVDDRNRRNGLYHNYVDAAGTPDPAIGVGILNGLPELAAYMQQGHIELNGVQGVLVCSDGFPWPAPLAESADARAARYQAMRERIERDGMNGYFEALSRVKQADSSRDLYPRFKVQDDCTGIYVEL